MEDKPGDYQLSTGNAYLETRDELGVKPRRSKKTELGDVESKSMVISNSNNMHASMNTRDSSKGILRNYKSLLYD